MIQIWDHFVLFEHLHYPQGPGKVFINVLILME